MASPGEIYQEIQDLLGSTSSSQHAKLEFVRHMADAAYERFQKGKLSEGKAEAELVGHLENMRRRAGIPSGEKGVIEEALANLRKRINEHPATVAFLEAKASGTPPTAAQKKAYDKLEDLWQEAVISESNLIEGRIEFQQAKSEIGKMADKIGKVASPKGPSPKKASKRPSPKKASPRKPSPKKASKRPTPRKPSPKRPSARPLAWDPPPLWPRQRVLAVQFDGEAAYPYYDELEGPFEIQMGAPGRDDRFETAFSVGPIAGSIADQLIKRLKARDIGHERVDASDQYTFFVTGAPDSYDDASTLTLGSAPLESGEEGRVVAVLSSNLDWQENRYQSGMYPYSPYDRGKRPAFGSPKKPSPKKPSPKRSKAKSLTYAYAKGIYEKIASGELEPHQFPSTRVVQQLGDWWIEKDGGDLLDGPFKRKSVAEKHRSDAHDRARKAVEKQTKKATKAAKKASPKKPSPGGPTPPYHGARDEQIVEFDNERVLWRVPTPGSTTVWWMITDYDGRMLPDTVGYKRLADAMSDWKQPAAPPKRLTPSEKPPVVEGVAPKVGKVHLRGVGSYDAIPAAYLRPGDITVWNEGITALVLDTEPKGAFVKVKVEEDTASGGITTLTRRFGRDRLVAVTGDAERRVAAIAEAVAVRPSARKRQSGQAALMRRPLARHLIEQFENALAPLFEGFYFRVYEDRGEGGVGVGVEAAQAPPGTTKQKALKSPVAVGLYITGYPKAGKMWIVGEPAPPEVQAYVRTVHAPRYMLPLLRFGHHEGLPQSMASDVINYFRRVALRIKSELPAIEMGQEMEYLKGFALKHPSVQRCLGPREIEDKLDGEYPEAFVKALVPRLARLAHQNRDMHVDLLQSEISDAMEEADYWDTVADDVVDKLLIVDLVRPTSARSAKVDLRRFVCSDLDLDKPPTGGDLVEHVEWALEVSHADPSLAPSLIETLRKVQDKHPHRLVDESEFFDTIEEDWAHEQAGDDHWIPDPDDLWQALRKALVVVEIPHAPESRRIGEYAPTGLFFPEDFRSRTPDGIRDFLADERRAWESGKVPHDPEEDDYEFEKASYLRAIDIGERQFKRSKKAPSRRPSPKKPSKRKPSPKRPSPKKPSPKARSKRRSGEYSDRELIAMCIMTGYKSFARPDQFTTSELGAYTPDNPIIHKLEENGLLKVSRTGTITPDRKRMKAAMKRHKRPKNHRVCNYWDFLPEDEKPAARKPSPKRPSPKKPSPRQFSPAHSVTATEGGIAGADQLSADLAMVAWQRMMQAPGTYYLYLTPSTATRWGTFHVVADGEKAPPGSELLTSERLPGHKDLAGITAWLRPMIRRAPILPHGGKKVSPKKPSKRPTELQLLKRNPPRIRRKGRLHVVEVFSPTTGDYIPQGEHTRAADANVDLNEHMQAHQWSISRLEAKAAKKPSKRKPSARKPSPKKPSERSLNILDAGAFEKVASIEGEAWERAQRKGGVKLANSFALNKAAYEVILAEGLGGLDIPLADLDSDAGVIAGSGGAAYIVMPDGEVMLDGQSTSTTKRAKAAKVMQVI
jgi:hypothetical protein